jgi:hypothetical protein
MDGLSIDSQYLKKICDDYLTFFPENAQEIGFNTDTLVKVVKFSSYIFTFLVLPTMAFTTSYLLSRNVSQNLPLRLDKTENKRTTQPEVIEGFFEKVTLERLQHFLRPKEISETESRTLAMNIIDECAGDECAGNQILLMYKPEGRIGNIEGNIYEHSFIIFHNEGYQIPEQILGQIKALQNTPNAQEPHLIFCDNVRDIEEFDGATQVHFKMLPQYAPPRGQ